MRYYKSILLLFICFKISAQQDVLQTQFAYDKLGYNPAYAGKTEDEIELSLVLRNQWIGLDGAPKKYNIGLNFPSHKNLGYGGHLSYETIGIFSKLTFQLAGSYSIDVEKGKLNIGLSTSLRQYIADFSDNRIISFDGIFNDPAISVIKQSKTFVNVGFGLYYEASDYYIGLSIPRLSKTNLDLEASIDPGREIRHLYLNFGKKWDLKPNLIFTPQCLIKIAENAPIDLDLFLEFEYETKYVAALGYRLGGNQNGPGAAVDLLVGMRILPELFAAISYDYSLTSLSTQQSGSLELTMSYKFKLTKEESAPVNPRHY